MFSARHRISEFIAQGVIPASRTDDALAAAGITPDGPAWRRFFDHLLLWLGGLALGFALMFFIAYNWQDLGRFAKFGMVEAALALAIGAFWKFGDRSMAGKVALLTATIFLGVLLALYGQTYQTGADPWQLFFNWALLMLPWALIGRFAALWIVWVALVNLAIVLYCQSFRGIFGLMLRSDTEALWLVLAFNTLALVAWELFALRMRWLAERWALRLLAAAGGRGMRKIIALVGLVIVLGVVNASIVGKEKHLAEGRVVYLELAPVDPRSLMPGDYMALRFALAAGVSRALPGSPAPPHRDLEAADGRVAVALDDGQPLARDEVLLRYRVRNGTVKFATNAFFFEEGQGPVYQPARFGQFRVDAEGELLLVALADKDLQVLVPGAQD